MDCENTARKHAENRLESQWEWKSEKEVGVMVRILGFTKQINCNQKLQEANGRIKDGAGKGQNGRDYEDYKTLFAPLFST